MKTLLYLEDLNKGGDILKKYKKVNYTKLLDKGLVDKKAKHCVFASICTYGIPYEKKINDKIKGKIKRIPMVLMQFRWDHQLGFPGGKVDKGDYTEVDRVDNIVRIDTLKNALSRELDEEININYINKDKLTLMSTYYCTKNNVYIHNFNYLVSKNVYTRIYKNSITADTILQENCGCINVHLSNCYDNTFNRNMLQNKFAATALNELFDLQETLRKHK